MFCPKMSVILGNVGSCTDRFSKDGYSEGFSQEALFDRVASIDGLHGVEVVWTDNMGPEEVKRVKANLERTGLKLVSIIPDHFAARKWGKGAFVSKDPQLRKEAVETTKKLMDIACELGCDLINLWPGQDGYDYPLQGDYVQERTWLEEGIRECCDYRQDVRISLEYKLKEPRNFSYLSNVSNTVLITREVGHDHCGVTLDYGHAQYAYENPAESVAMLKKYGDKLFHVHINDNYGFWDDDLMTGAVHTIPYIEFFYWLKRTHYNGWISIDQYPYREDSQEAARESMEWIQTFVNLVNQLDEEQLEALLKQGNAVETSKFMRNLLFGTSQTNAISVEIE